MNRKWIIPLFTAVAVGALAFGATRRAVCRGSETPLECLQDVSRLARNLELTESQAREIKELQTDLGSQLNDYCTCHCAARARLGQALAADTTGSAQAAEAVVADMCRAYEASERATLAHIRAVRNLLNAGQRRRFDAMISECMCNPCNMQGKTRNATDSCQQGERED